MSNSPGEHSVHEENIQQEQHKNPELVPVSADKPRQKRRDDFDLGKLLGEGAFGQVLEVIDKETKTHYAMKVLSKAHIVKEKKMPYVKIERDVMTRLSHPNITRLLLTFQDPGNLYYVIEYAPNGDLQKILNKYYAIDIPSTVLICGQILLGLAHIHKHRIIHRDLKPENILLDAHNRVKITDFGTSKIFGEDEPFCVQRGSFVGSADYVCPETLIETPVGPSSDLWSYGCILYTMLVGEPPFRTESNYATFQKIQNLEFTIPDYVPVHAKDLIEKLLVLEPSQRIGHDEYSDDYKSIREHPFFAFADWEALPTQPTPPWESFAPAKQAHDKNESNSKPYQTQVPDLMMMGEQCIFEGQIVKKRKLTSKKRLLVLTNKPRLFYVEMSSKTIMGDIPLTKDTTVTVGKGKKWVINIPGRKFDLQADKCDPAVWKKHIDDVLSKL